MEQVCRVFYVFGYICNRLEHTKGMAGDSVAKAEYSRHKKVNSNLNGVKIIGAFGHPIMISKFEDRLAFDI